MIRTIRPLDRPDPGLERVAKANGFSLHAGVSCERHERNKRERPGGVPLCRYIARPAVAVPRLSLSSTGKVVYTLKTPYRDGTTQVAFDGAAIRRWISSPDWRHWPERGPTKTQGQWNGDAQSRYHGVLAPNHRWRGWVTPAGRGKELKKAANAEPRTPAESHAAMTWAQRLKRVFTKSRRFRRY